MKIHTTQNLDFLNNNLSTNKKSLRFNQVNSSFYDVRFDSTGISKEDSEEAVSFKKKKVPNAKDAKKIIDTAKKGLEDIKDKATPEVKKGDKGLMSSFFNACINLVNKNENVFSAVSAATICVILRPLTIAALPTKKVEAPKNDEKIKEDSAKDISENKSEEVLANKVSEKEAEISFKGKKKPKERSVEKTNNIYAICQSIASGIMGIVTAIIVATPFKNGSDLVKRNMQKYLSPAAIKKLYPWVDETSIKAADGTAKVMKEWKNIDGRSFIADIKNCDMLPKFRKLSEVSKETFEKILKLDIDFAAQKGKSFNEVETKNGKKIYDSIDFDRIGIKVKEEGFDDAQILLKDLDKEYLEKLIADSKGVNEWGNLDINSVYNKDNLVKDFREWKNLKGESWKFDLDEAFITSELETADYRPRISGKKRFDTKDNEYKFVAYQTNGSEGRLGSEITTEMVNADASNEGQIKFITWLPDLIARVPVATATIALIPLILKNLFGIEKVKPKAAPKLEEVQKMNDNKNIEKQEVAFKGKLENVNSVVPDTKTESSNQISFKAGKLPKKPSKLTELIAKYVGKPLAESPAVKKVVDFINKIPGDSSEHYMVLGSFIQSGIYVNRTLKNKDMDEDRKKTLAINQALCFFIPTVLGYTVNSFLTAGVKKIGYRYSGLMKNKMAELRASGNMHKADEISDKLGKNIKAVGTLARLLSFSLIYRYVTPVLVTPIANKIGDKHIANKKAKEEAKMANS